MTLKVSKIARIAQKVLSSRTNDREPATEIVSGRKMVLPLCRNYEASYINPIQRDKDYPICELAAAKEIWRTLLSTFVVEKRFSRSLLYNNIYKLVYGCNDYNLHLTSPWSTSL